MCQFNHLFSHTLLNEVLDEGREYDGVHVLLEVDVEGVVEGELDRKGQVVDHLRHHGHTRLVVLVRVQSDGQFDAEGEQVAEHDERRRPNDHHGAAHLGALDPLAGLHRVHARTSTMRPRCCGCGCVEIALLAQRRAYLDQGAHVGGEQEEHESAVDEHGLGEFAVDAGARAAERVDDQLVVVVARRISIGIGDGGDDVVGEELEDVQEEYGEAEARRTPAERERLPTRRVVEALRDHAQAAIDEQEVDDERDARRHSLAIRRHHQQGHLRSIRRRRVCARGQHERPEFDERVVGVAHGLEQQKAHAVVRLMAETVGEDAHVERVERETEHADGHVERAGRVRHHALTPGRRRCRRVVHGKTTSY